MKYARKHKTRKTSNEVEWLSIMWRHVFPLCWNPIASASFLSSLSIIHVVNIKNNAEKDTTLLLFFLSKSPGGHVISFQIKPWVAFGLPYLLIELFYIGMPVVRTDGRSFARSFGVRSRDYQFFSDAIDYHISLAMGLRSCAALRAGRHAPLLKTYIQYNNYSGLPFEMQLLKGIK